MAGNNFVLSAMLVVTPLTHSIRSICKVRTLVGTLTPDGPYNPIAKHNRRGEHCSPATAPPLWIHLAMDGILADARTANGRPYILHQTPRTPIPSPGRGYCRTTDIPESLKSCHTERSQGIFASSVPSSKIFFEIFKIPA